MNHLLQGFEFISEYIDDLMKLTKGYWIYHVHELELTLKKLKEIGLKCNIENYFFGKSEMEYLGFWVTRNGVKSTDKKIQAIQI